MVQIVEQGPSDLSRFLQKLSPALDPLIENIKQRRENKALEKLGIEAEGIRDPALRIKILENFQKRSQLQEEDTALKKLGIDLTGISDPRIRQKFFETATKGTESDEGLSAFKAFKQAGYDVGEEHIPGTSPSTYSAIAKGVEPPFDPKLEEAAQREVGYKETLNDLRKLIPYTGGMFGTKTFGGKLRRETVQKRAEFDTLAFSLEGFLREMSSKGQLPQSIFEALLERLPSPEKSERENKGRIDAIEKIIERYTPKPKDKKAKTPNFKKVAQGTKLTNEKAKEIFDHVGGNEEEAIKFAQNLGYNTSV